MFASANLGEGIVMAKKKARVQLSAEAERLRRGVANVRQAQAEMEQQQQVLGRSSERFQALADSTDDALYRCFFESMPEGCAYCGMIFDDSGRPVDWTHLAVNGAFERLMGLKNVVGRRATELFPDIAASHPELFETYGRVALTIEPDRFVIHFQPLKAWLDVSVFSPAKGRFVAVFENITERKQAEKALQESEEKYRQLFAAESSAILLVDVETLQFVDANESAERLYGYTKEEFLSLGATAVSAEPAQFVAAIGRAAGGALKWVPLHYHRRKNGETFAVEISTSTFTVRGRPVVCNVIREITERVEASRALADSHERLRMLALKLTRAQEEERHHVARGLHDEVGQLLAACQHRLDLLRKAQSPERAARTIDETSRLLGQAADQIRELTFELNCRTLHEVGFADAVEELCAHMKSQFGIESQVSKARRLPAVPEEFRLVLYQAVRELLFNVVKHANAKQAWVRISRAGEEIRVAVEDNGKGFDVPGVDPNWTRKGGYGLFHIHEMLSDVGGRVSVTSKPGEGASVTIEVPVWGGRARGPG